MPKLIQASWAWVHTQIRPGGGIGWEGRRPKRKVPLVHRGCGELEGGQHIVACELWILTNDVVWRDAFSDKADDRGNRNPRAGDARHAAHDPVIDHHSFGVHAARVTLAVRVTVVD